MAASIQLVHRKRELTVTEPGVGEEASRYDARGLSLLTESCGESITYRHCVLSDVLEVSNEVVMYRWCSEVWNRISRLACQMCKCAFRCTAPPIAGLALLGSVLISVPARRLRCSEPSYLASQTVVCSSTSVVPGHRRYSELAPVLCCASNWRHFLDTL